MKLLSQFYLFFFIILVPIHLRPATIKCNRGQQFAKNKQLTVTVNLEPEEVLLKSGIRFSIDMPGGIIKEWKTKTPTISRYFSSFKRNKRVFEKEVVFELTLAGVKRPPGKQEPFKKNMYPSIYMFAFIVDPQGVTKSQVLTVPLYEKREKAAPQEVKLSPTPTSTSTSLINVPITDQKNGPTAVTAKHPHGSGSRLMQRFYERYHHSIKWFLILLLMFGSACVAIIMAVSKHWRFELMTLAKRGALGSILLIFNIYVQNLVLVLLLMTFLMFNAWYYLKDNTIDKPVLHYSKWVLGALCGVSVFPMFMYFYVMRCDGVVARLLATLF